MNIYQNNTYRKDLSWLHFYLEPMIQELVAARSTSLDMTTVFHTWPYDRFIDTEQPNSISPPPSFCWWDNFQFQILKRGRGGGGGGAPEKKWVPGGDLQSSSHQYLPGRVYYVSCQKKPFKCKIWLWGLSFKCWLWPVLAKQPINV